MVVPVLQEDDPSYSHSYMSQQQEERSLKHKMTRVRIGEIVAKYVIPGCGILFAIIYFCFGLYGMGENVMK